MIAVRFPAGTMMKERRREILGGYTGGGLPGAPDVSKFVDERNPVKLAGSRKTNDLAQGGG
jgi:hypothetical protein